MQLLSQGDERGPCISKIDWKLMKNKNEEWIDLLDEDMRELRLPEIIKQG